MGEHALGVHVGEAERSHHVGHALGAAIVFDSLHESCRHLAVVDKVDPSEAHRLLVPLLVGEVVYYRSHTSHDLAILIGKEIFGIAKVESSVAVLA